MTKRKSSKQYYRPHASKADGKSAPEFTVQFRDPFAPSEIQVQTNAKAEMRSPELRGAFYNDDIQEHLAAAISTAVKLGLPPLEDDTDAMLPRISRSEQSAILQKVGEAYREHEETSIEWLSVNCYHKFVEACVLNSDKSSSSIKGRARVYERLMIAAATAKEIQLSLLNKSQAKTGRQVSSGGRMGAEMTGRKAKPRTAKVLHEMELICSKGHTISNAAKLCFEKGFGTSSSANRQLWHRDRKNS
jgi:hypothetical protein